MRRFVEPELAAESCVRISPADLDRLEAHIPFFATDSDQVYAAHRAFHTELLRPAASRWDLRVLRPLWAQIDALLHSVFGPEGRTSCDVILTGCACRSLLTGYRTRDPEAARAATLRYLAHAERFAQNVAGAVR
ncbi:MAG: FCD domain-containing protein, partial [Pseudonocardia sp.]|nr:FCD domain-containing protein [Pseudonocardia sp.]